MQSKRAKRAESVVIGNYEFKIDVVVCESKRFLDFARNFKKGESLDAIASSTRELLFVILHESALVHGMIDTEECGEAVFKEWFDGLTDLDILFVIFPRVAEKIVKVLDAADPYASAFRKLVRPSLNN
jgi:hypothetical protein